MPVHSCESTSRSKVSGLSRTLRASSDTAYTTGEETDIFQSGRTGHSQEATLEEVERLEDSSRQ